MKHALVFALAFGVAIPVLAEEKDKKDTKEAAKLTAFQNLNYEKALDKAKSDKKIVMIDFTADWCSWCHKLDKETFSEEKVMKVLKQKTIAIKVDADKNPKLVQKYKVNGFPTTIFIDGEGKEVGRVVGFFPADKYLEKVNSIVK